MCDLSASDIAAAAEKQIRRLQSANCEGHLDDQSRLLVEIVEARYVLSDPDRRKAYDATLGSGGGKMDHWWEAPPPEEPAAHLPVPNTRSAGPWWEGTDPVEPVEKPVVPASADDPNQWWKGADAVEIEPVTPPAAAAPAGSAVHRRPPSNNPADILANLEVDKLVRGVNPPAPADPKTPPADGIPFAQPIPVPTAALVVPVAQPVATQPKVTAPKWKPVRGAKPAKSGVIGLVVTLGVVCLLFVIMAAIGWIIVSRIIHAQRATTSASEPETVREVPPVSPPMVRIAPPPPAPPPPPRNPPALPPPPPRVVMIPPADAAEAINDGKIYRSHTGPIQALAVSSDGELIASVDTERNVIIWRNGYRKPLAIRQLFGPGVGVAFVADGSEIIVADEGGCQHLDLKQYSLGRRYMVQRGTAQGIAVAGKALLAASSDGTVRHWQLGEAVVKRTFDVHPDQAVTCVAISTSGGLAVAGCADGSVSLWDMASGRKRLSWPAQRGAVASVAISPNGQLIATGGASGKVSIWDASNGQARTEDNHHSKTVLAVAFTPDGLRLVSGANDGLVKVRPIGGGLAKDVRVRGGVSCLAMTPDGASLVVGGGDQTLQQYPLPPP
jgi:hypothetical protein